MDEGDKTFIRVTNKHIYKRVGKVDERLVNIEKHVIRQNGKVGLNRKWLYGLSLIMMVILSWIITNALGIM